MEGIDPWSPDFTKHFDIARWLLDVGRTSYADMCLWIEYAFNYCEIFVWELNRNNLSLRCMCFCSINWYQLTQVSDLDLYSRPSWVSWTLLMTYFQVTILLEHLPPRIRTTHCSILLIRLGVIIPGFPSGDPWMKCRLTLRFGYGGACHVVGV
jgi:hypothetical protein